MAFMMRNQSQITAIFFNHPTQNPLKSMHAGRPIYDDLECVRFLIAGNKDLQPVFPAHSIATQEEDELGYTTPVTYAEQYSKQYMQFKNKEAQTKEGTPLSEARFLTPAKQSELRALSVFTVEALAGLEGRDLKMLGMEGRKLKTAAQNYIDEALKTGASKQQSQMIEELLARVQAQQDQIKELRMVAIGKGQKASVVDKLPPPEDPDEDEEADEEEDDGLGPDEGDRDSGEFPEEDAPTAAAEEEEPETLMLDPEVARSVEYQFKDMSDAQIKRFIADNTGSMPRGKLTRARLLELAAISIHAVQEESAKNAAENRRRRSA